jgi:glycosyltransferase involved in cell wall biosynthesis
VHALACIVPSVTYETFGMVTIEAFARKTPVIARDLGPLSEIVGGSGGGLIYGCDDELRDALHKLASSPRMVRELGENGYRAFLRLWSREVHLQRYFDLLWQSASKKFGYVPWETDEQPRATPLVSA